MMTVSENESAATPDIREAITGLEATSKAIWNVDAIAGIILSSDPGGDEFEMGLLESLMENVRDTLGPCCERIDNAMKMLDGQRSEVPARPRKAVLAHGTTARPGTLSPEAMLDSYKVSASNLTIEQCCERLECMTWAPERVDHPSNEVWFSVSQTFSLDGLRGFVAERQFVEDVESGASGKLETRIPHPPADEGWEAQDLERAIASVSAALDYEANGSNPATEDDSEAMQAGLRTALAILNELSPQEKRLANAG